MEQCATEMVCPPPSIGWSALILWTITVYGVLGILSVFTTCVHWREPSRTGARILGVLTLLDLVTAAAAPLVLYLVMGAPRAALLVTAVWLVFAGLCRVASRRPITELPPARVVR
jgi:uncharacterized membrane protein HdeD (DUF308 family)